MPPSCSEQLRHKTDATDDCVEAVHGPQQAHRCAVNRLLRTPHHRRVPARGTSVMTLTATLNLVAGTPTGQRGGQPLTAPVRPPTMRRWAIVKKMSVGSIDSAVNAKTFAVSAEYCDWNVATPSGNVKWIWLLNTNSGKMK